MPIHCTQCDVSRTDPALPCECGCVHWSTLPRDAVERLVERNQHLVRWTIGKFISPRLPRAILERIGFEDIVAAGNVGLLRAARRYDPSQAAFSTFAIRGIRWVAWQYVEAERAALTQPMPLDDEGEPFEVTDYRRNERTSIDDAEIAEIMLAAVSDRQRQVIEAVVMQGETLRDYGKMVGLTGERVRQIVMAGMAEMKLSGVQG